MTYAIEIKTAYALPGDPHRRIDLHWARVATRSTKREADRALREWLSDRPRGSKGRVVPVK